MIISELINRHERHIFSILGKHSSFYLRKIVPEEDLTSLSSTKEMYDSHEGTNYYDSQKDVFIKLLLPSTNPYPKLSKERDLDYQPIESFLLKSHIHISMKNNTSNPKIDVLDFGGNVGNHFYPVEYKELINTWTVVEVPAIAEQGLELKKMITNSITNHDSINKLDFIDSIDKFKPDPKNYTVIIMNGVIMHLENPYEILRKLLSINASTLFLGNNFEVDQKFFDNCNQICDKPLASNDYIIVESGPEDGINARHKYALHRNYKIHQFVVDTCLKYKINVSKSYFTIRSYGNPRVNYTIDKPSQKPLSFISDDNNYHISYFFGSAL